MSDRPKTIYDITEEMHKFTNVPYEHLDRGECRLLDKIDEYADRIEEVERERVSANGNVAAMRDALLSATRTMEIESRISCTEKGDIGKFGNTQSELCKRCLARNCECWQMTLKREMESALAAAPEPPSNAEELEDLVDAVKELRDGMCQHCDMRDLCAEGEDGMSTTCNAMAKVKSFIERHERHETNDEAPF